jgi:hypothetical protein
MEGNQSAGPQAICEKYAGLGKLQHHVLTKDVSYLTDLRSCCFVNNTNRMIVVLGANKPE